jgi:peptidyl-prolyl cis-trans isomerase B (cyclophilin B)
MSVKENPKIKITMEDGGDMTLELYPETAPVTVANFMALVGEGFYDGLIFHRVIPGFMIQGGCPEGSGMGGPPNRIKGEFASNGVDNPLEHLSGIISMARSQDPNSAGSQFFIVHKDAPHLDGNYAAFGKLTEGINTLNQIAETPTDYNDRPLEPQKIKSVKVM